MTPPRLRPLLEQPSARQIPCANTLAKGDETQRFFWAAFAIKIYDAICPHFRTLMRSLFRTPLPHAFHALALALALAFHSSLFSAICIAIFLGKSHSRFQSLHATYATPTPAKHTRKHTRTHTPPPHTLTDNLAAVCNLFVLWIWQLWLRFLDICLIKQLPDESWQRKHDLDRLPHSHTHTHTHTRLACGSFEAGVN